MTAQTSSATTTYDTGNCVKNSDGTLGLNDDAVANAVRNITGDVSLVLIGTEGGTITLPTTISGATATKISNEKDAALVLYKGKSSGQKVNKSTVSAMLKQVKFSSGTTSVNIAVTDGETSIDVASNSSTFGIMNAGGEAYIYKYEKNNPGTWFVAYDKAVQGAGTLGGFKGYLATVTTQSEANLLNTFYQSVSPGDKFGGWIGGTSMRYSSNKNITDYNNVPVNDKITPNHYELIKTFNGGSITNGFKIMGANGAYYSSNKRQSDYQPFFYWACGPEAGEMMPKELWNAGEPNNTTTSDRPFGEQCVVASHDYKANLNDYHMNNGSVKGYFLEFSAYDGGLTSGTTYKSTTFYKVSYDANGGAGDVLPFQTKFKNQLMTLAVNSGNLTKLNQGFNGWNTKTDGSGTHYDAGATLPAGINEGLTLYAEWVDDPAATPTVEGPIPDKMTFEQGKISGEEHTFSVSATLPDEAESNHALSYQWYASPTDSTTDGTPIDGANEMNFTIPTDLNPGKYYYYCKVTSTRTDKANRRTSVFSDVGTVTVEKLDSSVTNPPTAKENLAYNGFEQELVYGGAVSGGTMQYAIGTDDTTPPTTGWGTTIPKGTDAGPYYVWYKVQGDGNHNDGEPACKTVTIHPKAIKITADAKSKNYGETDPPLTYTVDESASGVTITGNLERDPGENAGTYPIRIGSLAADSANYRIDFTPALLTIHAVDAAVQKPPTPNELTYTGEAQDLIKPGVANGGTMQYALGTDGTTPPTEGWGIEIPTGTDADTYTVWYRVKGDGSHNDVSPRPINVTILPGEQPAPVDPPEPAKVTSHEITVDAKPDEEYSIDDGKTWVKPKDGEDTVTFGGLDPDKEYAIIARKAGTDNENPSPASAPLVVTTPLGKVETEIILGEGLVGPTVDGFDDAFAKKLNMPEDIKAVDDGENITYSLKIDALDNPSADDQAQCEKAAAAIGRGSSIGKYFDVSLYKKVGDAEPVKVADSNGNKVAVSFDIPPELLRIFPNGQRDFYVISLNGGKAERIPATITGNRISFLTDKFSTYALAYQDPDSQNSVNLYALNHSGDGINSDGKDGLLSQNRCDGQ